MYYLYMPYKDPFQRAEAKKRYFLKNKEVCSARVQKGKRSKRKYIAEHKKRPCKDCGVQYAWYVMDLDHKPGVKKIAGLAVMVQGYSWEKILAELEKCDVVCSNCHRIRTWKRKMNALID